MSRAAELAGCAEYDVETHDGRIGSVAAVLPRAAGGGALLVRTSPLTCNLFLVGFDEVEAVEAENRRLLLRRSKAPRQGAPAGARDSALSGV
jgi:hypothetical protein